MSSQAEIILRKATEALADRDEAPHSARVLREYQEDARAVAVAVLTALGGSKMTPGLTTFGSLVSQQILRLAEEIELAGRV